MYSIRKTTQWSGKLKNIRIYNGELITEDGDTIDLMDYLEMDADLFEMSVKDADFWKEKIGYDVIR